MKLFDFLFKRKEVGKQYKVTPDDNKELNKGNSNENVIISNNVNTKNDYLSKIFKIAHEGMENLKYPGIKPEGKLEILMFDIWFGIKSFEINCNEHKSRNQLEIESERIEEYIKLVIDELNLPKEKKYERVYLFRDICEEWENDILGLIHSDFPRTKQFMPCYMYLCIVEHPLIVFADDSLEEMRCSISISKVSDFLGPFCDHYNWLVKQLKKL